MKSCPKGHPDYEDFRRQCPVCRSEYMRKYYDKNREKVRAVNKAWDEKHHDEMVIYQRGYRKAHKDEHNLWERENRKRKPLLATYTLMLQRCYNEKHTFYYCYGGRGIGVCDRWKGEEGFKNFCDDMGSKPTPKHTLDRFPDNNGNYEPGNVRWATMREQHSNRRDNVLVTINGETKCCAEWARHAGMLLQTFWRRVKNGWPESDLLLPSNGRIKKPVAVKAS